MSGTVLLIEAEDADAQLLEGLFSGAGHGVMRATEARAGIEMARAISPDLILLAVELPGVSGYKACRDIKSDQSLAHIPLVITSSTATEDTFAQHRTFKTHADEYLLKPLDTSVLRQVAGNFIAMPEAEEDDEDLLFTDVGDDEDDVLFDDPSTVALDLNLDAGDMGLESMLDEFDVESSVLEVADDLESMDLGLEEIQLDLGGDIEISDEAPSDRTMQITAPNFNQLAPRPNPAPPAPRVPPPAPPVPAARPAQAPAGDVARLQAEIARLSEENERLSIAESTAIDTIDRLQAQNADLELRLDDAESANNQSANAGAEADQLRSQVAQLQAKVGQLEGQVGELEGARGADAEAIAAGKASHEKAERLKHMLVQLQAELRHTRTDYYQFLSVFGSVMQEKVAALDEFGPYDDPDA